MANGAWICAEMILTIGPTAPLQDGLCLVCSL
uniref:Uncharacterized protein n=1 Tax=Rhizophora mucronata TaxID=61149 RepID=A0A2P2PWH5_RHIMU